MNSKKFCIVINIYLISIRYTEVVMHVVRSLSVIGLAAYLIFQGIYYIGELDTPVIHAAIGLLGLVSGALMFISLGCWCKEDKRR
jgi:hypothetical protein